MVIGAGGSGKSTLALRLGRILGLPVVHLDVLHWKPGWVETPKEAWKEIVARAAVTDEWIIDGNFSSTLELRLDACDTVVFLDLPRALCVWRILKRRVTGRGGRRPDMAEGCREKLDLKFLKWVWDYPERTRPRVLAALERRAVSKQIVRLRSPAEVEQFLAGLSRDSDPSRATVNAFDV